jgi:uncharacterized membrane protein
MDHALNGQKLRSSGFNWLVIFAAGLLFIGWLLNTPPGLLGKADAVGYAVCHRIESRSFAIADRPLPLCARCTGMYLGAVIGLLYQSFTSPRRTGTPAKSTWIPLALLVLLFFFDGLNSFIRIIPDAPNLYEPQNWFRLLTGTGMGIVIAVLLYPGFNQSVWSKVDRRPAVSSLWRLVVIAGIALGVDILVLTENPMFLYPLAIISALGVIAVLTMVYCMVWLMVLKRENSCRNISDLSLPLIAGFALAIIQIGVLDAIRYFFMGTWNGFLLT